MKSAIDALTTSMADTLGKRRLTRKDYAAAAETIARGVLDGCYPRR